MGAVCNKGVNTKKIKVKSNPQRQTPNNDNEEQTNQKKIKEQEELNKKVGIEFQEVIEINDPNFQNKQDNWRQIQQKINNFQDDIIYIQLLNNNKQTKEELQQLNNIDDNQIKMKKSSNKQDNIKKIAENIEWQFKFQNKQILEAYIFKELNQELFQNILMKGPLSKYRWSFWIAAVYDNSIYDPNLYQKLKNEVISDQILNDIKKDLNRTFHNHEYFINSLGQQQLNSVLKALSILYDEIGYVQGMNYVVAFCLIVSGGEEEETFWFLHFINQNSKFQWWELYREKFPYAQLICQIFQKNFQYHLPGLYQQFQNEGVIDQQYIWQWILTQFIYTFPLEIIIQLWDFMIATDITSLIKLSISILGDVGAYLQNQDLQGISLFFSNFIKENRQLDIVDIIKNADTLELQLTDKEKQILSSPTKIYI